MGVKSTRPRAVPSQCSRVPTTVPAVKGGAEGGAADVGPRHVALDAEDLVS